MLRGNFRGFEEELEDFYTYYIIYYTPQMDLKT